MAKKLSENPTIVDTIRFELETPGVDGLHTEDPTTVDRVAIYYIKSDFSKINKNDSKIKHVNPALMQELKAIRNDTRNNPSPENVAKFAQAKQRLNASTIEHTSYFQEATPVFVLGEKENPVWHIENPMPSCLKAIVQDEHGERFGCFTFDWRQESLQEGNYYILWQWTIKEETQTQIEYFTLAANKEVKTSQEHRYTPDKKYEMLLNRYIPSMYQTRLKPTDMTPMVLKQMNACIASGFTTIEDLANRLIDVIDPSLAHESMLPLLANFFNLKLQSDDPIRWRQQIRRGIPLCKRKGTLAGLYEALDQAGINLLKITKLWQVVSEYCWTDAFVIKTDSGYHSEHIGVGTVMGRLSHNTPKKYTVSVRDNEGKFIDVPPECVQIIPSLEPTDKALVIWQGSNLDALLDIFKNDVVLINYNIQEIPIERESIEDYIKTLPLADSREDTVSLKNWNIRLIEDDDPLFDIIIKTRHPFAEPVAFGKVKTTFLYSEKVYNMDTYDGSLRDSLVPCDLDASFMDRCTYCQSSKFNVDLEIENLSSKRIEEAKEIIQEYSPFHAVLHSINITGAINDFVVSPQENIECLVQGTLREMQIKLKQAEAISYEVEWRDGSKEKGTVK